MRVQILRSYLVIEYSNNFLVQLFTGYYQVFARVCILGLSTKRNEPPFKRDFDSVVHSTTPRSSPDHLGVSLRSVGEGQYLRGCSSSEALEGSQASSWKQ